MERMLRDTSVTVSCTTASGQVVRLKQQLRCYSVQAAKTAWLCFACPLALLLFCSRRSCPVVLQLIVPRRS